MDIGLAALLYAAFACIFISPPYAEGDVAVVSHVMPKASEFDEVAARELEQYISKSVNFEQGGFYSTFDAHWEPLPESGYAVVYQSRMTWTLAEAARRRPDLSAQAEQLTRHGMALLADTMWDAEFGGFFWERDHLETSDSELQSDLKHIYGNAFAVYAAANAYRALEDPAYLDLARRAYRWIEAHARDAEHAGYYEVLGRQGQLVLSAPGEDPLATDMIGTAYGFKSMNTHLHLMEAYAALYHVWPDPRLREDLAALLVLIRDTIVVEPGAMNLFFTPDWRAVPAMGSYGHDVEAAYLMLEAADLLGEHEVEITLSIARQLVDRALAWGYDEERGGFYDSGNAWGHAHDTTKVWWAQAEALNALMMMDGYFGTETDLYRKAFIQTWDFTQAHLIDQELGGWLWSVEEDGTPIGPTIRANNWKGPYHSVRAMLNIADYLNALENESP